MKNLKILKFQNILLLIVILLLSNYSNSTKAKESTRYFSDTDNVEEKNPIRPNSKENQKVNSIKTTVNFDKNNGSCDLINASEKVLFTFNKPTNIINHLIFSTKFSFYNFRVQQTFSDKKNLKNKEIEIAEIEDVKTFSNTSVRKNFLSVLLNKGLNNNNFKENWLISIKLSIPVREIELKFIYNISNSLLVDPILKTNILHYQYINPYNYPIEDFKMKIKIVNYPELNKFSIKSPDEGLINDLKNNNGIVIDLRKNLPEMSLYSINLPLPYKIDMCDKGFFNIITMGLFFMTFIITALGIFTCFKISKE